MAGRDTDQAAKTIEPPRESSPLESSGPSGSSPLGSWPPWTRVRSARAQHYMSQADLRVRPKLLARISRAHYRHEPIQLKLSAGQAQVLLEPPSDYP